MQVLKWSLTTISMFSGIQQRTNFQGIPSAADFRLYLRTFVEDVGRRLSYHNAAQRFTNVKIKDVL